MSAAAPLVGTLAPPFELECARTGGPDAAPERGRVRLDDYRGRWLVLLFYPHDFSMVCPTELLGLSAKAEEFREKGCELLGLSCDPVESHLSWLVTPPAHGGVSGLNYPLASDPDGAVARAYGVYLPWQRVPLRGLFVIDPNGVLQYQAVHNLSVGRRTGDILRIVGALQSGGLCGENWSTAEDTIDPVRLLQPGFRLGHYQIEARVGAGSFATVFRARDLTLDRVVALKVFRPGGVPGVSVLAEARSAAALSHPNVCMVYAVDESLGYPVIAMEYVPGRPLGDLLAHGPVGPLRSAVIGRQVAAGMAAAHARGVVHGDLKPENVMVGDGDQVKILDFGLARRQPLAATPPDETLAIGPADKSDHGGLYGTPAYFAPEQATGQPATPATDVFALGLILHEMLTGRKAFAAPTIVETLDRVRLADPQKLAAETPEPFASLLRRALVPDPAGRDLDMAGVAEGLTSVLVDGGGDSP